MALLVLLNNFMHDFSAAGWLVCTVILWHLRQRILPQLQAPADAGPPLLRLLITMMKVTTVGIVVFGAVRAAAYYRYEWLDEAGDGQLTLLIAKHIGMTALVVWGIIEWVKASRQLKAWEHA
jgi:hypothetical protein